MNLISNCSGCQSGSSVSSGSFSTAPLTTFGSGRSIQRIIAGSGNNLYGSLGSQAGMPGRCGIFQLDTSGPTTKILLDNGGECGFTALLKYSTNVYGISSPRGLALLYDTSADVVKSMGKISDWLGGATDALVHDGIAYILRFTTTSTPPVPYITAIDLTSFQMIQYEFPDDIADLTSSVFPLAMTIYSDTIFIGTSVNPMLLSFDTTSKEFAFKARLNFYDSDSSLATATGDIRCMAANSSTGDIWGVVSGDPSKPPYIFKFTSGGVLSKEAVFDDEYIGSDVYSMTLSYADTTTTLYMGLRKASDIFCGAEIVKWDSSPHWDAPWASTRNIYGEKAITALYEDATYIYAGTAPNAILFKVQKSNTAITKLYTFGTGGSI